MTNDDEEIEKIMSESMLVECSNEDCMVMRCIDIKLYLVYHCEICGFPTVPLSNPMQQANMIQSILAQGYDL